MSVALPERLIRWSCTVLVKTGSLKDYNDFSAAIIFFLFVCLFLWTPSYRDKWVFLLEFTFHPRKLEPLYQQNYLITLFTFFYYWRSVGDTCSRVPKKPTCCNIREWKKNPACIFSLTQQKNSTYIAFFSPKKFEKSSQLYVCLELYVNSKV